MEWKIHFVKNEWQKELSVANRLLAALLLSKNLESMENLKRKRKDAIIAVCTLGLSSVFKIIGFGSVYEANVFRDTSLNNGGIGFVLKIVSFLLLTASIAIPSFIIHLFKLIYYQVEINKQTK